VLPAAAVARRAQPPPCPFVPPLLTPLAAVAACRLLAARHADGNAWLRQ